MSLAIEHRPLTVERIKSKQLTLGVVGLGYVGLPLCLTFAETGVPVIGFDIDLHKIETINNGESYIKHISSQRLDKLLQQQLFSATSNFEQISNCDAVLICVPTPLNAHLEPDLCYIKNTVQTLAPFLKPQTIISLESTTWPGTTEEFVKPIIEKYSPHEIGKDLYICFSPEREDPGNTFHTTRTIPKIVGAVDHKSLALATALYELSIDQVIPVSSTQVAELAKLLENIFRSVNIALVNELKIICDSMGINVWEVIEAAGTKPFGFMKFQPGPGLGGHCIPVDPFYLSWKAKQYGVSTRFIELAGQINRSMPDFVVGKVQDCLNHFGKAVNGSKIMILGLAYKPDIDDMRESPSLELMEKLEKKGACVDYHDPLLPSIGTTRKYGNLTNKQHKELSKGYDCFLLATAHSFFSADNILSYNTPVVDTRNFLPRSSPLVFPS